MIWFDANNIELKFKFCSDNWISFLIQLFVLTFYKRIELKKGQFGTKSQLPKYSLVGSYICLPDHGSVFVAWPWEFWKTSQARDNVIKPFCLVTDGPGY